MSDDNGSGKDSQAVPPEFAQQAQKLWELAWGMASDAGKSRIDELTARLDELEPELLSLREERDMLLQTRDAQGKELVERDRRIKELSAKMEAEAGSSGDIREQLADRERQLEEAIRSMEQLDARLREAQGASKEFEAREQELRREYEAKLQAEESRNSNVHEMLADRDRQLQEAEEALQNMEEKHREAQNTAQAAVKRYKELQAQVETEKESSSGLSMPADQLQSEYNRATSKLEVVTAERDRTERDLSDALKTIEETRQLLKSKEARIQDLQKAQGDLSADHDRVAQLEGELAIVQKKMDILNRECNAFADKNAALLKELEAARAS